MMLKLLFLKLPQLPCFVEAKIQKIDLRFVKVVY